MSYELERRGTVGFLATIITGPPVITEHCVYTVAAAIRRQSPSRSILGIHLEGHSFRLTMVIAVFIKRLTFGLPTWHGLSECKESLNRMCEW